MERGEYGKGNIRKRGKRFQISFYDDRGKRRYASFKTEEAAKKQLVTKITLRDAGKLDEAESRVTVDKIAAAYLADRQGTSRSYDWLKYIWESHLRPYFGGWVAVRLGTTQFVDYRNERLEAKASPSSINRELAVLRAIFNHAASCDPPKVTRVPKFPKRLKEPAPRKGFLGHADFDMLLSHCKHPALRALMLTAYTFGFRRAELVGKKQRGQHPMRVRQIDMKARTIELDPGTTKNEEPRRVRMTQEVFDALKPCVEGKQPNDFVFAWPNGKPIYDFRGQWANITKAAGMPGLLLHDFRRSAVRNLDRAGISRDVSKKISGHKTDSIFSRYNIVSDQDLAEATSKLEAHRNSGKLVAGQNNI